MRRWSSSKKVCHILHRSSSSSSVLTCHILNLCLLVNAAELMLLGFISLMLVVSQDLIQKICIDESLMGHWLPCLPATSVTTAHYGVSASSSSSLGIGARRLLKGEPAALGHCSTRQVWKCYYTRVGTRCNQGNQSGRFGHVSESVHRRF
jgi:hypothetical protein